MLTRREAITAAVAIVLALAAIALTACTTTPPADLPAELPHYPCTRQDGGKTVYFACSADEWLHQQITRKDPSHG